MGRCHIVVPEVVRLPLSDGDYIDIKKELNAGEYIDFNVDLSRGDFFARALAYLVGWSLFGADGPLPYGPHLPIDDRRATLRNLKQEPLHEILKAIDDHVNARETEKKTTPATESASSPILQSVG